LKYEVSIIIPTYNKVGYTRRCLEALATNTPDHLYEVIIVDNGSTDATRTLLKDLEGDVKVILNPQNQGFARACNTGAQVAEGEFLLFLNNDTEPLPGWLENLLRVATTEHQLGAVGCKLLFPDNTVQHAGVVIGFDATSGGLAPYHLYYRFDTLHPLVNKPRELQAVTGACLLIPRNVFFQVGGFDEQFYNGYEDVDLCLRLRERGYRVVYTPWAQLIHHESVSGPERFRKFRENLDILNTRWSGRISPDDTRIYLEDGLIVRYEQREGTVTKSLGPIGGLLIVLSANSPPTQHCSRERPWPTKVIIAHEDLRSDTASPPSKGKGLCNQGCTQPGTVPSADLPRAISAALAGCDAVLFWSRPTRVPDDLILELLASLTLAPNIGAIGAWGTCLVKPDLASLVAHLFLSDRWEQRMLEKVKGRGYKALTLGDSC